MTISQSDGPVDHLGPQDVERLLQDRSEEARAETVRKVAQAFSAGSLSDEARMIGVEIFRAMVRDAAIRVRSALSENLKTSSALPHDIALALARDVEAVALPMLESSDVLTDADLLDLVASVSAEGQQAIARRETVSSEVVDALVEVGQAPVVLTLLKNPGATLTDHAIGVALDRVGQVEAVQEALVKREKLPVTVAERLVALVSDKLRDYLVTHHELPGDTAADLVLESRERATVALLPPGMEGADVERLVEQLQINGRLTPTLILRALCLGDLSFFEASIARLARVPLVNARVLIHDTGKLGLHAICRRALIPERLYPAIRIAFDVVREADYDGGDHERERLIQHILERISTQAESFDPDDLDYLMRKLDRYAAAAHG